MKRHDGQVSDETVDAYRAIIAGKSGIATKPVTPGAGVSPSKVCKPSKRIRNWHRNARSGASLKQWVAISGADRQSEIAQRWLASKGIKP